MPGAPPATEAYPPAFTRRQTIGYRRPVNAATTTAVRMPAAERRQQIQRQESAATEEALQQRPEDRERVHVEGDVQERARRVHEGARQQAPRLTRDRAGVHQERGGDRAAGDQLQHVEQNARRADRDRDDRRRSAGTEHASKARPRGGGTGRRATFPHALRALDADRGLRLALGADRATAPLAEHPALALRMPVADPGRGRRLAAKAGRRWGVRSRPAPGVRRPDPLRRNFSFLHVLSRTGGADQSAADEGGIRKVPGRAPVPWQPLRSVPGRLVDAFVSLVVGAVTRVGW